MATKTRGHLGEEEREIAFPDQEGVHVSSITTYWSDSEVAFIGKILGFNTQYLVGSAWNGQIETRRQLSGRVFRHCNADATQPQPASS